MAKFAASVAARCREGELGADRRDAYRFDRRVLYRFLRAANDELQAGRPPRQVLHDELHHYYVDAVASQDRRLVKDMAESLNLTQQVILRARRAREGEES